MNACVSRYRGKPVNEMTRDELIEAVETLGGMVVESNAHYMTEMTEKAAKFKRLAANLRHRPTD